MESCYGDRMSAMSPPNPRTASIPVTTMEEIALLEPRERDELVASLMEAEKELVDGRGEIYDAQEAKARFLVGFKRRKSTSAKS